MPFIFGRTQPAGVISDTGSAPPNGTQETFGALRTGYAVDVSDDGSGNGAFWGLWYRQAPDVALNHPERWSIKETVADVGDGTCRLPGSASSNFDCAVLGDRLPQGDVWSSTFHHMRGLFITGASKQGPQLTTATTGDQLALQVRVYNLSLAPLPPDANVVVRFMAMPWDTTSSPPASSRPSFTIGQQVIPGERTRPVQLRWHTAELDAGVAIVRHERHELRRAELRRPGPRVLGGRMDRERGRGAGAGRRAAGARIALDPGPRRGFSRRRGPRGVVQQQSGRLQPGVSHLLAISGAAGADTGRRRDRRADRAGGGRAPDPADRSEHGTGSQGAHRRATTESRPGSPSSTTETPSGERH